MKIHYIKSMVKGRLGVLSSGFALWDFASLHGVLSSGFALRDFASLHGVLVYWMNNYLSYQ
jgi:hypothetical protein